MMEIAPSPGKSCYYTNVCLADVLTGKMKSSVTSFNKLVCELFARRCSADFLRGVAATFSLCRCMP